jgi:hypothetical protein
LDLARTIVSPWTTPRRRRWKKQHALQRVDPQLVHEVKNGVKAISQASAELDAKFNLRVSLRRARSRRARRFAATLVTNKPFYRIDFDAASAKRVAQFDTNLAEGDLALHLHTGESYVLDRDASFGRNDLLGSTPT